MEYVYGIVPAALDTDAAPPGLDDSAVRKVVEGDLAALVSTLDGGEYSGERFDERATDLEWLGPRARAHDAVVSWASEPGPVVPLPMWTMFAGAEGVSGMLAARGEELRGTLARVSGADEYSLRVFAKMAEVRASLDSLAPELAEAQRALDSAAPGQRYLMERKLETQRKEVLRTAAQNVATRVFDELADVAADSLRESLPRSAAVADAQAVLNAVFLVERARFEDFRRELTRIIESNQPKGFHFEFTGPWPAYHFVGRDET